MSNVSAALKTLFDLAKAAKDPQGPAGKKVDAKETKAILKAVDAAYDAAMKGHYAGQVTGDELFISVPCSIGYGLARLFDRKDFVRALDWKHMLAAIDDGVSADPNPPDIG